MKLLYILFVALFAFIWMPTISLAKKVYSPIVKQGGVEVGMQNDVYRSKDGVKGGSSKHQIEVAYSFTDRWHSGLYTVYQKASKSRLDYTASKLSNIFQVTAAGEYWLDMGLYAEYIWTAPKLKIADVLEFKVLLEKPVRQWKHTFNLVYKKTLEDGAEPASLGYAWRSRYKMKSGLEPAIEIYGSLGATDNITVASYLIGPVLEFKVTRNLEMNVGWLMDSMEGLAYGAFKLNAEYAF